MRKIGCAHGIAWTPSYCSLIQIKTTVRRGSGKIHIHGDVGETFLKSLDIVTTLFDKKTKFDLEAYDATIRVPGPLDGPSASVALYVSLYSAFFKIPIDPTVAFIGKLDKEGKLHSVGGVPDKLKAASRAKLRSIVMPFTNYADIPAYEDGDEPYPGLFIGGAQNIETALILARF